MNRNDYLGLAETRKGKCVWELYLGHGDRAAIELLSVWLLLYPFHPDGSYHCGDKLGFRTCAAAWFNSAIPPQNRLPLPIDKPIENKPDVDDSFNQIVDQYPNLRGFPDLENYPVHSGDMFDDAQAVRSLIEEARAQCKKKDNCCKTIVIDVVCDPKFKKKYAENLEILRQNPHAPKIENPCQKIEIDCES